MFVTVEDIKSSKRNSELVLPRQIFMYLCREMIGTAFQSIADILAATIVVDVEKK